jgi:outer membrane lipoprotein-sorting protein
MNAAILAGDQNMRRTFGLIALAGAVAFAVAQGPGAALLSKFGQKLSSADSVSSTYTIQAIGSSPDSYTIALKKPNLVRFETPTQLVIADGKQIFTYEKASKSYFKKPQSDEEVRALLGGSELDLFRGFFNADAYKAAAVKDLGAKNRKGQTYTAVQASVDPSGKKTVTYFLAGDDLARAAQIDLNDPNGKVTYIVDTKTFEVGGAFAPDTFSFTPPADAKEITLDDLNSDKWYTNLAEAQKVAAKTNKLILVDFYADW